MSVDPNYYYRGKQNRSLDWAGVAPGRWDRWTEREDKILMSCGGHGHLIGAAKQLGRTYASVRNRYYNLRRAEFLAEAAVHEENA